MRFPTARLARSLTLLLPTARLLPTALLLAASLLGAGCGDLLAPRPDPARYWVLGSTNATAGTLTASSEPLGTRDVHIGLGPIKLPDYLKDNHVLVRSGANQIENLPADYWAEPLESGFPRALVYDISQGLHTASALLYPWFSNKKVAWAVPVDVLQFESSSSGEALLVARWRIVKEPDGASVFASESRIAEPADGTSTEQRVAAQRRSITRLAAEIVAEIDKLSLPKAPPAAAAAKSDSTAPKAAAAPKEAKAPAPPTSGEGI